MTRRHRVVMVATSYPRFPGDLVGTFMEPIARGIAARGHEVHLVLPWHPRFSRPLLEGGVRFHLFRYAPVASWNVFGYAAALQADVSLRRKALAVAPLAVAAGWRLARTIVREVEATVVHGHWVLPGGAMAAWAAGGRPLVVSLHGSDVFLAERTRVTRAVARHVFGRARRVIACSDDLRERGIALGARADRSITVPYGVDADRFRPDSAAGARLRERWQIGDEELVVFSAGRFVRKKGFEYLIDAVATLAASPVPIRLVLAGAGDLDRELRDRIAARGVGARVLLPGIVPHDEMASALAAADIVAIPSVRDESGNVDGLPNTVLEALASGTPVVATTAGGIASVVEHEKTGLLVPERDATALASAIRVLAADPARRAALGAAGRARMITRASWAGVAERIEDAYDRACDVP
jgi:glycosyltransferase involved in cell wall biosynthesis